VLLLLLMAFSIHLLPLSFSSYPFNNDSLVEGRAAREILDTGELALPWANNQTSTHSESTPAWNLVLAFFGGVLGMDPMFASQWAVAAMAPVAALTVYLLLLNICRDRKAALMGSFFITLFGTFVYLTASGWKESIGVALYFLLIYVYTRRDLMPMKFVLILVLLTLPFVHHLIALVAYMTVLFLTGWSLVFAAAHGVTKRRHVEDTLIIVLFCALALGYYGFVSFDKLSYIGSASSLLLLLGTMLLFFLGATVILLLPSHLKFTFAPIPAALIVILAYADYNGKAFDYTPSTSAFNYYLIAVAGAITLFFAWYGLEYVIESKSRYRAVPIGLLLPPLTLMGFALMSPTVEDKHQLIYRTFDMADPAIALGLGIAIFALFEKKRLKRYAPIIAAGVIALLLTTLPYGLYTEEFTGVRHDTQKFEMEAFEWVKDSHWNETPYIWTDERLSFIAWTVYDLNRNNLLPYRLVQNLSFVPGDYNIYEEYWSTRGVSDYPRGITQPTPEFMDSVIYVQNVFYISGPTDDQLIIIQHSWIGQIHNNWYYHD